MQTHLISDDFPCCTTLLLLSMFSAFCLWYEIVRNKWKNIFFFRSHLILGARTKKPTVIYRILEFKIHKCKWKQRKSNRIKRACYFIFVLRFSTACLRVRQQINRKSETLKKFKSLIRDVIGL